MAIVLILAAVLLLLAGAALVAGAAVSFRRSEEAVRRRVDVVAGQSAELVQAQARRRARVSGVVRQVLGVGVVMSWPSRIAAQVLLLAGAGVGLAVWLVLVLVLRAPHAVAALGAALGFLAAPQVLLRLEQDRLERRFVEMFPDAVDMTVRMLRAGLPLSAAIRVVGTEAASPVKESFAAISDQMSIGVSFDQALVAAGKHIRVPDFRFFAVAAVLQQSTGGNLAVTLDILSEIMRKRRAARLKAKAVTAEVRMSTYVLAAIPFFIIGGLILIAPAYLRPLVTDPHGKWILVAGAASMATGFFVMRQMMRSAVKI
jgi:tight adherence protein B